MLTYASSIAQTIGYAVGTDGNSSFLYKTPNGGSTWNTIVSSSSSHSPIASGLTPTSIFLFLLYCPIQKTLN